MEHVAHSAANGNHFDADLAEIPEPDEASDSPHKVERITPPPLAETEAADFVTVATTLDGKLATKEIYRREDGQLDRRAYGDGYLYKFEAVHQ